MSRCVYFCGKNLFGFVPEIHPPDNYFPDEFEEYIEIYERHLKKPLRGQSIKQMECTAKGCYLLTTEMSQVFFISPIILKVYRSDSDNNGVPGCKVIQLTALGSCHISLIGTGREAAFFYSQNLNQMWCTDGNLSDNSLIVPNLTQVELPIELKGKEIVKMNGTIGSVLFLTADGLLFALGQFSSAPNIISRVVIPGIWDESYFTVAVTDVQSGKDHTLVLLSNGKCYGIGSSLLGQLTSRGSSEKLTWCNIPGRVIWIRACLYHSFFGTDDGCVYTCGFNEHYRLALPCSRYFVYNARPLNFPRGQVKHVFGCKHTTIVDKQNTVYITGSSSGDCNKTASLAKKISILTRPTDLVQQISSGEFIIDVIANEDCSFLHLKTGRCNDYFAKKLWFAQRNHRLLDIDIITHHE